MWNVQTKATTGKKKFKILTNLNHWMEKNYPEKFSVTLVNLVAKWDIIMGS